MSHHPAPKGASARACDAVDDGARRGVSLILENGRRRLPHSLSGATPASRVITRILVHPNNRAAARQFGQAAS